MNCAIEYANQMQAAVVDFKATRGACEPGLVE